MKRLVIAGLLVFLLVLLVTFPARVAYNWFAPAEVQLSGISGSIWQGSATEGIAGGAYIRNLKWKFRPLALLRGQLAYLASASPAAGTMNAELAVSLDGTLSLFDLYGRMPLNLIHPAFQQNGIQGDVVLQFAALKIRNGLPVEADGSVTVADFFAPVLSASRIGDFRADFQTTSEGISGVVQDVSGVLDVEGTIELLQNRSYIFTGQVAATAETPPSITNQLRFLGSADERGQRPFRFEGQL
jgi:general secretion pathway protein N